MQMPEAQSAMALQRLLVDNSFCGLDNIWLISTGVTIVLRATVPMFDRISGSTAGTVVGEAW